MPPGSSCWQWGLRRRRRSWRRPKTPAGAHHWPSRRRLDTRRWRSCYYRCMGTRCLSPIPCSKWLPCLTQSTSPDDLIDGEDGDPLLRPVHLASESGRAGLVALLLDRRRAERGGVAGRQLASREDDYGRAPLAMASYGGYVECMALLIERVKMRQRPKKSYPHSCYYHRFPIPTLPDSSLLQYRAAILSPLAQLQSMPIPISTTTIISSCTFCLLRAPK